MSILITDSFRQQIARNTLTVFSDAAESIYLFYGKSLQWDDTYDSPPSLIQSTYNENLVKSNILALKKISSRDIILGVPRVEWQSEPPIKYDYYTDQESMVGKNYYVITDENKVYKCLDNNDSESIEKPTHTDSISPPTEEDGYIWQYMFSISQPLQRKFTNSDYIPIDINDTNTQEIMAAAVPGTINKILLNDGASDYSLVGLTSNSTFSNIPLYVLGNGDEVATAKIRITGVTDDGAINTSITEPSGLEVPGHFAIIDRGSGYSIPNQFDGAYEVDGGAWIPVLIRQLSSQTSTLSAEYDYAYGIAKVNSNQKIESLRITNPGKGYTLGEAVIVQSSCIAYADIDSYGAIDSITISHPGENFTVAQIIPISDKSPVDTNVATFTPIISPTMGHGSNPEIELNARAIMFSIRVAYEELTGDFPTSNDFRSVGIIHNPMKQHTDGTNRAISTELTLTGITELYTSDNTLDPNDWPADDMIIGTTSGARGKIVEVLNNSVIRIIRDAEESNNTPFLVNESIISGASTAVISSIKLPEYVPYSGDVLLINNIQAIERSNDQIETINFILNL